MREGVVLYDRAGREIWACPNVDSRSAVEARQLIQEGAAEKIFAEAGDWVSITTPARLRWLAHHRPGILGAVGSLGMLSDWIVYRLSGTHVTEPSCGSSSGMFTLSQRRWSQSIPALCGLPPDVLPPVADPGTVVGEVTAAAAGQTGLRAGTPVVAGGADTQLGLLGAGVGKAEYTVIAGTFWQNTVLLGEPLVDPEARLRTLCHVVPGEWMLEGIGFYCGMSMRWFRDAFCDGEVALARARGVDPYLVMEEAAAKAPLGGVIAIMSNLMNAKRWVHASPSFLQFNLGDPGASGRGACIRAIEEAAAFVARGHRDIIGDLTGLRFGELVFTGGAAKGRLWPQIMADVLAVPVHVPVVTESSGLGAALCAGVGAGIYASLGELPASLSARSATFEPDPAAAAGYDERYPAWRTIYGRMLEMSEEGLLNPLWRAAGS
jgi:autoinducer 2 (AI-2) kinase